MFKKKTYRSRYLSRKSKTNKSVIKTNDYGRKFHYCGDGFKGFLVRNRKLSFCGFCGKEFRRA